MARVLRLITGVFGAITIGFGINALSNPESGISFFELDYPSTVSPEKTLVDTLLAVYAVRDIFMGITLWTAAYFGSKKMLGIITLALGAVAAADGVICQVMVGHGQWNHWGYAPMAGLVGLALLVI